MDNSKELGQAPVGKLLWKYFVPAIIGVLANTLYNLVDRVYIGHGVGALALSGLTVTFPIMIIAVAIRREVGRLNRRWRERAPAAAPLTPAW